MGDILEHRRASTTERLGKLINALHSAARLIGDKACVYVTGSAARGEMSTYSDLDLFIVSDVEDTKPKLSRLDAIVVKAELINATKALGFPPFSGDGKYLETYTTKELCENLGTAKDDHANTFTARLLLLLESKPLLGDACYQGVIKEVLVPYWKDYARRSSEFRPVFLINDIIRMWKTLCVNYEARTEQQPDWQLAKRKLTNYKLKHSRVLTCYSALLYLMQVFHEQATVRPADVVDMVKLSPTERLEWINKRPGFAHGVTVSKILDCYERFLESTNKDEAELIKLFMDPRSARSFTADSHEVGDAIVQLLQQMGSENGLYRYLIV